MELHFEDAPAAGRRAIPLPGYFPSSLTGILRGEVARLVKAKVISSDGA